MQNIKIGDRVRLTVKNGFIVGNVTDITLKVREHYISAYLMIEADGGFMYPFHLTTHTVRDHDFQIINA
jgi:sporulation protein YlmC with PRC-barrel domain